MVSNQSFVGSVVIDAEFGREDHCSIPAAAIGRDLKSLDPKTDPRTRLNRWRKQNKNDDKRCTCRTNTYYETFNVFGRPCEFDKDPS
jgi:hypothetical protein